VARSDWAGVSLPIGLLERLEGFLKSDFAKYNGFHSKADLITDILREYLDQWEQSEKDKGSEQG